MMKRFTNLGFLLCGLALSGSTSRAGGPSGNEFLYQGQLQQLGKPANDTCDFQFRLHADEVAIESPLGSDEAFGVPVVNGLFQVELDFGVSALGGAPRWMEIDVGCGADEGLTTMFPRVRLSASPYSVSTRGIVVTEQSDVGIGTDSPISKVHIRDGSLGLGPEDVTNARLIVESPDSTLGLFSDPGGTVGSAIQLGEVSGGEVLNNWTIRRATTGAGGDLQFNHTDAGRVLQLDPDGKVGIGTTDPQSALHVDSAGKGGLRLERNEGNFADTHAGLGISSNFGNPGLRVQMSDDDGATFDDAIFIDENTNVGIGTTTPTTTLHVAGGLRADLGIGMPNPNNASASMNFGWQDDVPRLRLGGSGAGNRAGFHIQGIGDKTLLRILDNGKVGIGTETPGSGFSSSKLDVIGGHIAVSPNFGFFSISSSGSGIGAGVDTTPTDDLPLFAGGVDRAILLANGNFGVGTTNPTARLHVSGPSGDAGVKLPGSSIGPAETLAEAGVAHRYIERNVDLTPTDTWITAAGRSITVPSDGYILAFASADVLATDVFPPDSFISFALTQQTSTVDLPTVTEKFNGFSSGSVSLNAVFPVTAGLQNVFLWAVSSEGAYELQEVNLTLLFVPTAYGTVDGSP